MTIEGLQMSEEDEEPEEYESEKGAQKRIIEKAEKEKKNGKKEENK
jgi:hypothetical protein